MISDSVARRSVNLIEEQGYQAVEASADERGAGNGKHPSPNDAASYAPANGGEATRSADANNRAGNGVGGADGNAEFCVHDEREAAGGFRGESAEGSQLRDALAHGFDDAPAARHRAAAHREVADDDDPVRNCEGFEQAAGDERGGDDAHAFLRIVGAVAKAKECSGEKLQAAKPFVDALRPLLADEPTGENRNQDGEGHADKW